MKDTISQLKTLLGNEQVLENEPLSGHTSFRIGGPCSAMVFPRCEAELKAVLNLAKKKGLRYFIMGNGTNLLCDDRGFKGLIIKTTAMCGIEVKGCEISAYCGSSLAATARAALKAGLAGLEFAHGIPGSVGGGIVMNAGAYGKDLSHAVVEVVAITKNGEIVKIPAKDCKFGYRTSIFTKSSGLTVIKARFLLRPGEKEHIKSCMAELLAKRKKSQPLELPNAGSVFKRPEGYFAGKLIEESGLKGKKIGGAEISNKHAGFIVNTGGARCSDVLELVKFAQGQVKECFGVDLECEIKTLPYDED